MGREWQIGDPVDETTDGWMPKIGVMAAMTMMMKRTSGGLEDVPKIPE